MVSRRPLLLAAVLAVLSCAVPVARAQQEAAAPEAATEPAPESLPAPGSTPAPAPAPAAEAAPAPEGEDDPFALDVHGFVSQGFLLGLRNNYLAKAKHGSFEFAEAGINFTKPLSDRLRVGLQLFARDLGPLGNYKASVDWFYLDYRFNDWLGLRAGRVKVPFGLYNEINDIDAARAFVLLPPAMYPVENRDFLLAQTGVELYGYAELHGAGALDYRVYGGTILLEDTSPPGSPRTITEINIPYLVGGRLLWETPLDGLHAGGSLQLLRLDFSAVFDPVVVAGLQMMGALPATATGAVDARIDALLGVVSIEYAAYDWQLAAEYSRWHTELESSEPALAPENKATAERMYALVAYRVTSWLQPGAYYALYFPDEENRSGRERQQHDVALAVRFDINEHWLVKLEGHYFNGTAQLRSALNDGKKLTELKRNWGLLLAKTTAYF
jgi:hypothetical protein